LSKAIDEICKLLVEKFERKYRGTGLEEYVKFHRFDWASQFRTVDIYKPGFQALLKKLKRKRYSEKELVEMAWRGKINEDPILIEHYLYKYEGILFKEVDGKYELTDLAISLMKEIGLLK